MKVQRIASSGYRLSLGLVNSYLIASPGGAVLIDCGMPGNASKIEKGLQSLGLGWDDLKYILITHCHPDHAGSLAEIQRRAPSAITAMHPHEAALVREGIGIDPSAPLRPAPGFHNFLLFHGFVARVSSRIEPARVDLELHDGQRLHIGEGIDVYATPGHTRGHLGFLWHSHQGVFFAGDAASSLFGPGYAVAYENLEVAQETLRRIGELPFQCVCFGHGAPLVHDADQAWAAAFEKRSEPVLPVPEPLCAHSPQRNSLDSESCAVTARCG